MRRGGIAAIAVIALTLAGAPRAADGTKLVLTPPRVKWSLRIDLPDFVLETPKAFRDFTQVWTAAQNRHTGVGLTVFIAKVGETRDAGSCRKYYLKRADQSAQVTTAERKGMALAERMLGTAAGGADDRKDLHAYIYRDGFCIDLHLVKPHYKDDQKRLLFSVLDAVSLDPATEADRSEMATYAISSGPGEDLTIDAARSLRDRNFAAADALLARPCPWATGKPPGEETFATADCGLRSSGAAEARADKSKEDLARMYWRAGDAARRGGGLRAAEQIYRKSLDLDPNGTQSWYALGQVYREQRNLDGALEALRHALEQKPDSAEILYWVASTLSDQGKLDEADAMFARAQQADPKDGRIRYRRGQVRMKRDDNAGAIESFEKARELGFDAGLVKARIDECRKALAERSHP